LSTAPALPIVSQKTFEKEQELVELRVEQRRLEQEIAAKIRATQMKAVPEDKDESINNEQEQGGSLDHSENLRPLRLPGTNPPDYPAQGIALI